MAGQAETYRAVETTDRVDTTDPVETSDGVETTENVETLNRARRSFDIVILLDEREESGAARAEAVFLPGHPLLNILPRAAPERSGPPGPRDKLPRSPRDRGPGMPPRIAGRDPPPRGRRGIRINQDMPGRLAVKSVPPERKTVADLLL